MAARLTVTQIRAALKRGGRQRNLHQRAKEIQSALRTEQLTASDPVAAAFSATTKATVGILLELNRQLEELEAVLAERLKQHPDAVIYLSMPGLGDVLGARALGEFGDDPNRYADAKSRKNYAGTSPITVASGKNKAVLARHVKTGGSMTPSTSGPSAHSPRVQDAKPSTTNGETPETSTTRPSGP